LAEAVTVVVVVVVVVVMETAMDLAPSAAALEPVCHYKQMLKAAPFT
jgi:hypothetical protein